jgi:hypothetical protein
MRRELIYAHDHVADDCAPTMLIPHSIELAKKSIRLIGTAPNEANTAKSLKKGNLLRR